MILKFLVGLFSFFLLLLLLNEILKHDYSVELSNFSRQKREEKRRAGDEAHDKTAKTNQKSTPNRFIIKIARDAMTPRFDAISIDRFLLQQELELRNMQMNYLKQIG